MYISKKASSSLVCGSQNPITARHEFELTEHLGDQTKSIGKRCSYKDKFDLILLS